MRESVRQFIQKRGLIPPGSMLVVGVSGGADSLALLHVLNTLRRTLDCELHAATLDHHLRGEEGAADARFVEEICHQWGVAVTAGEADVRALAAKERLSVEAAARRARYDFLADVARRSGADQVAVAHHADDQAETVLMRLLRGAGLGGLGGMRPRAPLPGHPELYVIRPFLRITRSEIEAHCRENGLSPRQDSTNMDTSLLRNRLRLETLPQLEALKPGIRRLLAQVADIAGMDDDYIDVQLQTVVIEQVRVDSGRVTFPRDWFRALHPALARRLILHASEQLNAIDSPDYAHIIEAVEIGLRGRQGALALLGSHLRLRVDYDRLVIEREDSPPPAYDVPLLAAGEQLSVPVPGNLPLEGWMLCTSLTATPGVTEARMSIPPGAVVTLRTRRAGDRFAPPGMGGKHQKLARWMVNRKLPRTLRDRLPLICVDGQVAAMMIDTEWIIAEPFVVRENSAGVVHFHFRQIL